MSKKNAFDTLLTPLPEEMLENLAPIDTEKNYIKKVLSEDLPQGDRLRIDADLKRSFMLDKHSFKKGKVERKKCVLSRKNRKRMELMQLPKVGWKYKDLEPMRKMWKDYMRDNLDAMGQPQCSDQEWNTFSVILSKIELIGSEIEVIRSKVPSTVGTIGTVVLETKNSLQIVTSKNELKVLLKQPSIFRITLAGTRFTFFGKHLVTRPVERSVKKIKSFMTLDL